MAFTLRLNTLNSFIVSEVMVRTDGRKDLVINLTPHICSMFLKDFKLVSSHLFLGERGKAEMLLNLINKILFN